MWVNSSTPLNGPVLGEPKAGPFRIFCNVRVKAAMIAGAFFVTATAWAGSDAAMSKVAKTPHGDFTFSWHLTEEKIAIKASVKCSGWIGVGFNDKASMEGARLVIGRLEKGGKGLVAPFFGATAIRPEPVKKLGGKIDLENDAVERDGDLLKLSFTIPLKAADKFSYTIDPGKVFILISYADHESLKEKHDYRDSFSINLMTGK